MKAVLVCGFFNPVFSALQAKFASELRSRCIIWVPQRRLGDVDINQFKQSFFDRVAVGATDILVLLAIRRGREFVSGVIQSIISEGLHRRPAIAVALQELHDPGAVQAVAEAIGAFGSLVPFPPPPTPPTLDGIDLWAERELGGRLILHPRALRGAKRSRFEDVPLVYRSLLLLGNEYHSMKTAPRPDGSSHERFAEGLNALGLELSESMSASRAGEQGDDYFVKYGGEKRFLQYHLKKGADRDERYCFRLYFFWDGAEQRVVVGWLPSHLQTRGS